VTGAALTVLAVMWWGYWLILRDSRPPHAAKPVTTPTRQTSRKTSSVGIEDDPDRWPAARNDWTALDECQLLRLLTDSSPVNRPATNPPEHAPDHAVPHAEHEDTT
jgi:hypothetical protein